LFSVRERRWKRSWRELMVVVDWTEGESARVIEVSNEERKEE
jgi:hypothetical protein